MKKEKGKGYPRARVMKPGEYIPIKEYVLGKVEELPQSLVIKDEIMSDALEEPQTYTAQREKKSAPKTKEHPEVA